MGGRYSAKQRSSLRRLSARSLHCRTGRTLVVEVSFHPMTIPPSPRAASPKLPLSSHALLGLALVPFLLIALLELRAPLDLSIGDQAQYILHARSILTGRG